MEAACDGSSGEWTPSHLSMVCCCCRRVAAIPIRVQHDDPLRCQQARRDLPFLNRWHLFAQQDTTSCSYRFVQSVQRPRYLRVCCTRVIKVDSIGCMGVPCCAATHTHVYVLDSNALINPCSPCMRGANARACLITHAPLAEHSQKGTVRARRHDYQRT